MRAKPIGVFGGIFDPVHNGHLAVAQLARDFFGLSKIVFVPAGVPPHKSHTVRADAKHRLAMLRLAVRPYTGFSVSDIELRRGGISYTIDTLTAFERRYPNRDLHFLIGSDNLVEIPTWRRYRDILDRAILCVAHRPGHPARPPRELARTRIVAFPSPEWGISSTLLRSYLALGYRGTFLVPDAVLAYIRRHGLYETAAVK